MLELDIILINFLETKYNNIEKKNIKKFKKLLKEDDKNLQSWLIKGLACKNKEFIEIISIIKNSTKNFKFK